jgi:PIN domain nuclease of toxin-antitoxin system
MKILIDTHILLWWLADDPKLTPRSRAVISDPENRVLVSQVSLWETAIKQRVGKLQVGPSDIFPRLPEFGLDLLPLDNAHLLALESLPVRHGDPFDHLLLAQALHEKAVLMSADRIMQQYGVPCLPA